MTTPEELASQYSSPQFSTYYDIVLLVKTIKDNPDFVHIGMDNMSRKLFGNKNRIYSIIPHLYSLYHTQYSFIYMILEKLGLPTTKECPECGKDVNRLNYNIHIRKCMIENGTIETFRCPICNTRHDTIRYCDHVKRCAHNKELDDKLLRERETRKTKPKNTSHIAWAYSVSELQSKSFTKNPHRPSVR